MNRSLIGGAMVLGAAALWGTLGLFARALGGAGLSSLELAGIRAAGTALGLGAWLLIRHPARLRITLSAIPFFAAYGLIGLALFHFLYFATLERTSIAVAVALLYTAPAFVVIAGRILYGEPIDRRRGTALALVLAGVFLVTGALRLLATGEATISAPAIVLGLGSGVGYGLYTVFGKSAVGRFDSWQTVFYPFVFAALALSLIAPPWRPFIEHPQATIPLILLVVVPTLLPYLLYINGLRHLPSGTASILASIEPVVATLLGFIFLGEAMTSDQLMGVAAIVAAALILARGAPPPASGEGTRTAAERSASMFSASDQT